MKAWGGRFGKPTSDEVEAFTASISFDRRLYRQDILGSIAHCRMLGKQSIISAEDAETIVAGLRDIYAEIEAGTFVFSDSLEDIHMNIETRLRERIGEVGGKLHTARSRNDQIALDLRLWIREMIIATVEALTGAQAALLDQAERNADAVLPGYTHLQRAQPVLLAHHLLAYFEMLQRDAGRFADSFRRADVMPLGSGALAGSPYPLDRESVARDLGFAGLSRNSMDAVCDRDFVVEYLSAASLAMAHLSRLAEETVIWTSAEFGYLELDDAFATGSSIMPQKKNPDVAELVRGKVGRVYGSLFAMLTILKGLPLTYNRDLQEDKEALFDAVDTLLGSLRCLAPMLATARFRVDRMRQTAGESFTLATDVADYLVRKGMPFREAHAVVGRLVSFGIEHERDLLHLTLDEYRKESELFDESVFAVTVETSVAARDVPGGTAPKRVAAELADARRRLAQTRDWAAKKAAALPDMKKLLG